MNMRYQHRYRFPWPSTEHRNMAEVKQTEVLLALKERNKGRLVPEDKGKLDWLLQKARKFNPPSDDQGQPSYRA
jgi:hypothetical protein